LPAYNQLWAGTESRHTGRYVHCPAGTTTLISLPQAYNQGSNTAPAYFNYTRTFVPRVPLTDPTGWDLDVSNNIGVSTTYMSGNGQPLMSIARNATWNKDLIVPYDHRPSLTSVGFLPYTAPAKAKFQMNPLADQRTYYLAAYPPEEGAAYSKSVITDVNDVRTSAGYTPGKSFSGQDRGTTGTAAPNTAADNIECYLHSPVI